VDNETNKRLPSTTTEHCTSS